MDILGARQRHRHRSQIFRENFPDVPATPQPRRILRHRHRPHALQEDSGAAWGPHLGRTQYWARIDIPRGTPRKGNAVIPNPTAAATPIEILLVEDSPGDIRLTREALRDAK